MDASGFRSVTRLADARAALREVCDPHGRTERRGLAAAVDRVLAAPVTADRAVPHYDRAAMDGYAVRATDTHRATDRSPTVLTASDGPVGAGEAAPVDTGDALPDGADAVVRVEATERRGDRVEVAAAVPQGENVGPAGEDVDAGQRLFEPGRRLRPSDLALARAAGRTAVETVAPPRVSVLPTGEELVDPGTDPAPGEVVETNGLLVSTLAERWGGAATYRDVVTDDVDALRAAVTGDADHDVVVTTGGSSVGDRDLVADAVAAAGEMRVHGVAVKPGHPVGFGVVEETPVLVLPGYPVSCLVTAVQFLRPALSWLAGTDPDAHPTVSARLTGKVPSAPGERTFARVRFADGSDAATDEAGPARAVDPVRSGGASVLSSVAAADGWVVVPESREGVPAGETVAVQRWDRPDVGGVREV